MYQKTIAFDFDGCIHSYTSGWQGETKIPDPPVKGIPELIEDLRGEGYKVVVFTTRATTKEGAVAVRNWLNRNGITVDLVTAVKPLAVAYVDDRGIRFDGDVKELKENLKKYLKK